jgi:glycosyltransferase involved in cell wall biosynthesis
MNKIMQNELTIVIPCKNEENYIGSLLSDLKRQENTEGVRILIADAGSNDGTLEVINNFKGDLNIEVIQGGLPAVARNNGLKASQTEWTLFIDADAELSDNDLIKSAIDYIKSNKYELVTCKINSEIFKVKILYKISNFFSKLSKLDKPFAVGMFMLVNTQVAKNLGGFPEWAMHCEDYLFSRKFDTDKFAVLEKYVYSDDRRFTKISYWKMIKYFYKNIRMRNNIGFFKKDINYWV